MMDRDLRLIKKIKKRNSRSAADELISSYYKKYIFMFLNKQVTKSYLWI